MLSRILFSFGADKGGCNSEAYHSLDPEAAAVRLLESAGVLADDPTDHMALARRILL